MASLIDLIKRIRERPEMYISFGYICCLQAFLDGWCMRDIEVGTQSDRVLLLEFQSFVTDKYHVSTSQSWASILLFFAGDESKALKLFFEVFDEFLIELEKRPYRN